MRVVGAELTLFVDDEEDQRVCVDVGCGRVLELEPRPTSAVHVPG